MVNMWNPNGQQTQYPDSQFPDPGNFNGIGQTVDIGGGGSMGILRWNDQYAQCVSFTLVGGRAPTGIALAGEIIGRISWGAGGTFAEALVDFVGGCCGVAMCNSLSIDAQHTGDPDLSPVALGAFCGPGGSAQNNMQRTLPIPAVLAAGTTVITIPAFAKKIKTIACDVQPWALSMGFQTSDPLVTGLYNLTPGDHLVSIPIPNDASDLIITNTGIDWNRGRIVFEIDLN